MDMYTRPSILQNATVVAGMMAMIWQVDGRGV